jgi:hypothetical protein
MGWSDLDWSKPNVLDYRYTSQIHEAIMERAHVSRTAISNHYPPDAYSPPDLYFMKWIRSSIEKLCVNFYITEGEIRKWTLRELYLDPMRNLAFTPDNQDFLMLWNNWLVNAKNCLNVLMYSEPYRRPEGNKLYASSGWPYEEDGVKYNYFTTSEDAVNAALIESVTSTPGSYGVTDWGFRGGRWLGLSDIAYQAWFNIVRDIVVHNDFALACIPFVYASEIRDTEFDLCGSDWTKAGTFLSSLNAGNSVTIESVTPSERVPDIMPVLTPPSGENETEYRGFALNTLFYWGCEGGFKYYEDEEEE